MEQFSGKLIILRGNSASGKTTVAKRLRELSQRKIAYVEQDNIRRTILKEKEVDDGDNIALISQIVEFALSRNYDVILEGMLKFHRYGDMLKKLVQVCPDNHVFYFDTSLEETFKRHATKPIALEVSESDLRDWYKEHDVTGFENELLIPEEYDVNTAAKFVLQSSGL
jgi:adenylate kinase family enzyme